MNETARDDGRSPGAGRPRPGVYPLQRRGLWSSRVAIVPVVRFGIAFL